jgi:hypothetical protein
MPTTLSQVHTLKNRPEFRRSRLQEISEELARIEKGFGIGRIEYSPLFPQMANSKRQYPDEAAGRYLCWYLEHMRPSIRKNCLKLMRPFLRLEKARERQSFESVKRVWKECSHTVGILEKAAMRDRLEVVTFTSDGLLVRPTTLRGLAACAVLALFDKYRMHRIRRCMHCHSWFYARFKHQQFCNDPKKKCQWKHYHTPDWRKQHREQNRKHQRVFRERTFGTRRN